MNASLTDAPGVVRMRWRGAQYDALTDETRYLDIEGAFRAAKTTIGLWKELNALLADA